MPQTLGPWRQLPFSYFKVCLAITACFFGLLWVSFIVFFDWVRLTRIVLLDAFLVPLFAFMGCALIFHVLYRIVWNWLSEDLRANLAYDLAEGVKGNGTIHSFRELYQWVRSGGRFFSVRSRS